MHHPVIKSGKYAIKHMNRDLGIDFFNSKDQESKEEFSWK